MSSTLSLAVFFVGVRKTKIKAITSNAHKMDIDDIAVIAELHVRICKALHDAEATDIAWLGMLEQCAIMTDETRKLLA